MVMTSLPSTNTSYYFSLVFCIIWSKENKNCNIFNLTSAVSYYIKSLVQSVEVEVKIAAAKLDQKFKKKSWNRKGLLKQRVCAIKLF